jgi:hypothetical protein
VFLNDRDQTVRGQVAHLNRDRNDNSFENLAWLCLEHHDEYDSRTFSQSKGLTEGEIRHWRDELVRKYEGSKGRWAADGLQIPPDEPADLDGEPQDRASGRPWRYPLWQTEDQVDLFAYTCGYRNDGVCFIERIDLPDGRSVVVCSQAPGNPGTSITNGVEAIAAQVCARFELDPAKLIWLEHYPGDRPLEWSLVTFGSASSRDGFADPSWRTLGADELRDLGLEQIGPLSADGLSVPSNLRKLFDLD